MLEINKVYKWQIIVSEYPNMWAFITDIKEKDGQIISCRLLAICSHKDKAKYIKSFKRGISILNVSVQLFQHQI